MEEFTIYTGTLPNGRQKIGVDSQYPRRIRRQKLTDHSVLEVHTDIYEVSRREIELQRIHNVEVDHIPYHVTYFRSKDPNRNAKISEANTGKTHTKESKRNMSESHKGKILSKETRRKMSEAQRGNTNGLGFKQTEDFKQLISEVHKGIPKKQVTCTHCNKTGGNNVMYRWHFDNCKQK